MPNAILALVPPLAATRAKTRHAIFTKRYLDGLPASAKAGSQWEWYYDIRTSGLAIGVGQTGVKTFYLIRKFEGKAKRYVIGKYPAVDIEVARRVAQDFNGKLAQGIDPTADDKNAMTFEGLFDKFMNEYSYRRNITAQQNVEHYNRYLATDRYGVNLAKKRLKDIKRDDKRYQ